jgi:hypothetical protein
MIKRYLRLLRNIILNIRNSSVDVSFIKRQFANDIKNPKVTTGRLLANFNNQLKEIKNLHEVEFQVFSQWGDDGIIQYLINKIDIPNKSFVEFGVENYTESNTRFLLINNNWSGLVIDGSEENVNHIKNDIISWGFDIYAKQSFITKENINNLLNNLPFGQDIGILSIDIDGNDYYIWKEITVVNPVVVIVEYNSLFGFERPVTIPYSANFVRDRETYDMLFYGSSLLSLCDLANQKGYVFIGCNSAGNNAYFIRQDKLSGLKSVTIEQGFVLAKFREFVDRDGRVAGEKRIQKLVGKKVFNTRTEKIEDF